MSFDERREVANDQFSLAQCNGGVERVNKVIKPCLPKLIDIDQDDWDVYLPMAISSYNNSFQSSIKMTPYETHYGRPGAFWCRILT